MAQFGSVAHNGMLPARSRPQTGYMSGWAPSRLLTVLVALIVALVLIPLLYLILRSASVGHKAIELLIQPRIFTIIGNSLLLAALVTILSIAISLPVAWLTTRTNLVGRRVWGTLTALPLVFPSYVGSFALIAFFGPRGTFQSVLEPFGVEQIPSIYGLFGTTWALTFFTYPYMLLSIRAGLRNLDPALEEAARSLGHNAWQTFWRITLPGLRTSIISGSLLVSLYVLSDFGAVSMLRYNTFTRAIYLQYTSSFDRSLAALLALVLVLITISILVASRTFRGRGMQYRASAGVSRKRVPIQLGKWQILAQLFCFVVVGFSLLIPTAVVLYWLMRGVATGESILPVWTALQNSLQAATLTALTCVLLAIPVSYLVVRFPNPQRLLIGNAVYVGYGLPGIAVALSLVFFGANYVPILYQSLALLIFAYTVRFLPQAVGTIQTNLLQISPRLEEASRGLGLGRRHTFRTIIFPLMGPGIWTGAALVFLTTIKELPATLLLSPTGFTTLATQIWSATEEAFFARAAAPALLLLVISALSIGIIMRQEERA